MRLLLHAITLPTETEPDAEVHRVGCGDLTAWASLLADDHPGFTREDLLAHHYTVEAIFAKVDSVLPARFPTIFHGDDEARRALRRRRDSLTDQLERVRGCAEIAVTALWTSSDEPKLTAEADTPGRQYLMQRQAAISGSDRRRQRAKRLAQEFEQTVGTELVEARHTLCPSQLVALSSALLVRRSRASDLVSRLVRAEHDVRILVNGPWPPYTFAAVGSD